MTSLPSEQTIVEDLKNLQITEKKPIPNAGVFPYAKRDGKILFMMGHDINHRKEGQYGDCWSGFGGKLEDGETLSVAALRELREESGDFFPELKEDNLLHSPCLKSFSFAMYLVEVPFQSLDTLEYSKSVTLNREIDKFMWVDSLTLIEVLKKFAVEEGWKTKASVFLPGVDDRIKPPFVSILTHPKTIVENGGEFTDCLEWLERFCTTKS